MSTPGGAPERVPSTVKVDKTTGAGKPPADAKTTGPKKSGSRPATKAGGGGKGRKPVKAVKMNGGRNWGPIAVIGAVVLISLGIIGWGAYAVSQGPESWEERAANIQGVSNFRESDPELMKAGQHQAGPIQYKTVPPVAGPHNAAWQTCMGSVYDAPIANEHAVHSLEHGAVWVTYKAGLPADQVTKLTEKVQGKEKMLLSPVQGLDRNVSLQAWGYQLKVDTVDDARIDDFIRALRTNATVEPGATCSSGVTVTGDTPQAS